MTSINKLAEYRINRFGTERKKAFKGAKFVRKRYNKYKNYFLGAK
jgi:hypothetical protein